MGFDRFAPVGIDHAENFPVATWLCPRPWRAAVLAIYRYARTADDMADEGDLPAAERREALGRYRAALQSALAGRPSPAPQDWPAVLGPLAAAVQRHRLPARPFEDLLDAFVQDTANPAYADRAALLDYCRRSADPVGRLMLALAGIDDACSLARSDAICSALQLINFWQDLSVDLPRGRRYVPEREAAAFGLHPSRLGERPDDAASQALVASLVAWAWTLMREGAPLVFDVPGRFGWELRGVVQGGVRVLQAIEALDHRVLHRRPALRRRDLPVIAARMLRMRPADPLPGWRPRGLAAPGAGPLPLVS